MKVMVPAVWTLALTAPVVEVAQNDPMFAVMGSLVGVRVH
jgi:hypothetical protein